MPKNTVISVQEQKMHRTISNLGPDKCQVTETQ